MECLAIFVGVLIVLALLFGVGTGGRVRSSSAFSAFQRLAVRYGGVCDRRGWFAHPIVRFAYWSAQVELRIGHYGRHLAGGGPLTQLAIQGPDFGFHCEVTHPPFLSNGATRIQTDSPEFNRCYAIDASDPAAAVGLLNPTVRWQIDRLRRLAVGRYLHVEFSQGRLLICRGGAIRRYPELSEFVERSLELYDQALIAGSKGIDFLDDQAAQPLEQVQCRICGEQIRDDLVYCRRCKTPHHRQCWQYNGACSVFACGETRFEVPRVARRTKGPRTQDSA